MFSLLFLSPSPSLFLNPLSSSLPSHLSPTLSSRPFLPPYLLLSLPLHCSCSPSLPPSVPPTFLPYCSSLSRPPYPLLPILRGHKSPGPYDLTSTVLPSVAAAGVVTMWCLHGNNHKEGPANYGFHYDKLRILQRRPCFPNRRGLVLRVSSQPLKIRYAVCLS